MAYRIFVTIFLLLVVSAAGADPADSRYRVEIIVLTHLEHDQAPDEVAVLADFSDTLDFLTPPPAAEDGEPAGRDEAAPAPPTEILSPEALADSEGGAGEDPAAEPACSVVPVTEMGPEMQEAWRRLRLSGPFRPLQYLAWEQPGEAPFPELRIHDLETVLTEDPWQFLREPAAGDQDGAAPVFGDTVAGDSADPSADAGTGPLPAPIAYFRLDGKAQLVRTRFLHLALTVELREPVFDPLAQPPRPASALSAAGEPQPASEPQPTGFRVQRLEQRRQVRTGRMEYFDGPVIGVLAFITDVSDMLADEADQP